MVRHCTVFLCSRYYCEQSVALKLLHSLHGHRSTSFRVPFCSIFTGQLARISLLRFRGILLRVDFVSLARRPAATTSSGGNRSVLRLGQQPSAIRHRGRRTAPSQVPFVERSRGASVDCAGIASAVKGPGQLHRHARSWRCQGNDCNHGKKRVIRVRMWWCAIYERQRRTSKSTDRQVSGQAHPLVR